VEIFGDRVSVVAEGVTSPWSRIASFSLLLFIVYIADASIRLWRRGGPFERRRATLVGGSIILTLLFVGTISALKHEGLLVWPYLITPGYLFILMAIGYELACDIWRAAELARRLNLAEERIQLATTAAGIGIWEWRPGSDELWASETARGLLGLTPADAVSAERFFGKLLPEHGKSVRDAIEGAQQNSGEFDTSARVAQEQPEPRWVALRGSAAADSKQRVVRGVVFDITERKGAEQRLRMVAEGSPNAVMMVDRDGRIVFSNARASALFGYDRGELLGKPIEMLVPSASRPSHEAYRRDFVTNTSTGAMRAGTEVHGLRKDGAEIPVEVWLTTVRIHDDLLVLVNVIDISVRRSTEAELARQRQELAHLTRVAMIGELSGSLAHELNQPLTAILTNAQATQKMAENGALNDETLNEILQDIVDDSKRAGEVIRRLRSFIRRGEVQRERLDMNGIVADVLRLLRFDLVARGVTVDTELAPVLPGVLGDHIQLQQVLLNLIMNACEAMESVAKPCTLTVRSEVDTGGAVRISVIDAGTGIPADELGRIFEPFVTTKSYGMGLGLAVCRTIIEHHGGSIGAYNNESAPGATFHFSLPAVPTPGS